MRRRIAYLSVLMPLALLAGCGRSPSGDASPAKDPAKTTVKVTVTTPAEAKLTRKVVQPGEIHADKQTPMFALISAHVLKVYKDIGDSVKEGEVMATLFVPDKEQTKKQKEALVLQAQAELEQANKLFAAAEADVSAAEAKVREAKANEARAVAERERAESQLARFKKSGSVITPEVLDEARLGVAAARAAEAEVQAKIGSAVAEHKSKESRRDKAKADIAVADAHVKVAVAEDAYAGAILGFAQIKAPFTGIVTKRNVDPGVFVQPGGMQPLFVVASIDPVRVVIEVPEADAELAADGAKADVIIAALGGEERSGTVTRSAWGLDAKMGRTLRAEIDLKNPGGKLRPGMYVTATINIVRPKTLTLPTGAVLSEGGENFCYMVESGKARRTPLRLGVRSGAEVEVLSKKTAAGWQPLAGADQVVTNPGGLSDGQEVTVQSASEKKS